MATIRIPTPLRKLTQGKEEVTAAGGTVGALIAEPRDAVPRHQGAHLRRQRPGAPLRQHLRQRRGHPLPAEPRHAGQGQRRDLDRPGHRGRLALAMIDGATSRATRARSRCPRSAPTGRTRICAARVVVVGDDLRGRDGRALPRAPPASATVVAVAPRTLTRDGDALAGARSHGVDAGRALRASTTTRMLRAARAARALPVVVRARRAATASTWSRSATRRPLPDARRSTCPIPRARRRPTTAPARCWRARWPPAEALHGSLAPAARRWRRTTRDAEPPPAPAARRRRAARRSEIGREPAMTSATARRQSRARAGCASPRRSPTSSATRRSCGCARSSATRPASSSGPSASS